MIVEVVAPLVLAAALQRLGSWGWRNAPELPPPTLSSADRAQRTKVLRRGSVACQVLAVMFLVVAAAALL